MEHSTLRFESPNTGWWTEGFTILRLGFQSAVCCVPRTWFEGGGGFAHFLSGGVDTV